MSIITIIMSIMTTVSIYISMTITVMIYMILTVINVTSSWRSSSMMLSASSKHH